MIYGTIQLIDYTLLIIWCNFIISIFLGLYVENTALKILVQINSTNNTVWSETLSNRFYYT